MERPDDRSDTELLALARGGDEDAFVALYRRRQGPVYRFALRMTGSAAAAEEVAQEVFLTLVREPERYDASLGPLAAFLFGVARNLALRRGERGRTFVPIDADGADAVVPEGLVDRRDPHGELESAERVDRVRRAVMALPAHYRDVVVLCDLEEVSYADAADALGCSVGTVRSRLHRARSLLVEKLRASEESEPRPEGAARRRCFA
jgi:RNA polymerase sigma-70 factor (ECF subfamily)